MIEILCVSSFGEFGKIKGISSILPKTGPFDQESVDTRIARGGPTSFVVPESAGEDEEEGEGEGLSVTSDATRAAGGGNAASIVTAGTSSTTFSRATAKNPESPAEWLALVEGVYKRADPSKLPVSDDLKAKMKGLDDLGTIAFRFKELPETKTVLLAFGLDHFYSYETKQRFYKLFMDGKFAGKDLIQYAPVLLRNSFKSDDVNGYFLLDIKNNKVETFCKRIEQVSFTPCPSSLAPFVAAATTDTAESEGRAGAPIVAINTRCGKLFGFLVAKQAQNMLSMKTVENTTGGAESEGADCAGVSNKEPHLLKIQILKKAVEASGDVDLLRTMYPLAPITKEKKSAARKSFIEETSDMKQSTLCIYLEFICRLMDARRVGGKRWFLNDVEYKRSYDAPGSQWPKLKKK